MASHEQTYSSDFKAKIALKALEQSKRNLDQLSEKYEVPVSVILSWTAQLERNAGYFFEESDTGPQSVKEKERSLIDVQTNHEAIAESLEKGVMGDHFNYKNLIFWGVLGIAFTVIFVQLAIEMYQVNPHITSRNAAGREYSQLGNQKQEARDVLSSFGVVNLEKGVYRVPIDSVINTMAVEPGNEMTVEIDSE